MIDNIKQYIDENINEQPLLIIYEKLKTLYNDHDIRFTFLTFYNYDIDTEYQKEMEEREKRRYQKYLRKKAFEQFNGKCAISNVNDNILLEVAHMTC